ncbi:type IV pilin, putative [Vibrio ichthyoenteri ATCC 700023]|uniref:Type II secretion system protein H n=1 Tax=Vibrio ichthyoenteri ATCC 700023 TaxID=870968 RepID=F9S2A4_9VIBR|nr:GspH/FimT family pseudopilin [Vibrio ichthyoenteri]EGU39894.1 type IV pilin, putative [Vibrio ichthyoenteri ATCC 700023]
MVRGFTLLELMITVALMASMLLMATPSITALFHKIKMQRLAGELNGFLLQAKSEAVMRNQKLYAHFSFAYDVSVLDGSWQLSLTDSSSVGGALLLRVDGAVFQNIEIRHTYRTGYITFDAVRGRPNGGHIGFHPQDDLCCAMRVTIANPPGRVKICSDSESNYGYPTCS